MICNSVVKEQCNFDTQLTRHHKKQVERKNLKTTEREIDFALRKTALRDTGRDRTMCGLLLLAQVLRQINSVNHCLQRLN